MGNRTNLILNNESKKRLVFEANNHLPFFWLLLLDLKLIEKNESEFLKCFESTIETCDGNFKLRKDVFEKNTKNAKAYLKKNIPEIISKYEKFSDYIKSIISDDIIELDFIEIVNFYSSPIEFLNEIKKTLFAIKEMTLLDEKDVAEYLYSTDYFYLEGYDDLVDVKIKFSNFSQEYNQLKIESAKQKANEDIKKQKKKNTKEKKGLVSAIFMSVFGLLMLIAGVRMTYDNQIGMGITIVLFGLLSITYGCFEIKKGTNRKGYD